MSGPNVVELHRAASNNHSDEIDQKEFENTYKTIFDVIHNNQRKRGEEDKDVPAFVVTIKMDDGKPSEFVMSKRCERIFYHKSAPVLEVPLTVRKRYADLVTLQKNNPQKPPLSLFRTSLSHDELKDGDLVYYRQEKKGEGPVTDIVPVKISRKMAGQTLGNMLLKSQWKALMPCTVSGINERDFSIPVDKDKRKEMADLQLPHPDGLCPACSVFGTPFYAHRVGFGFAVHEDDDDGDVKWYKEMNDSKKGGLLTLKTPQSPRPAWIIPEGGYGKGISPIPGRKFYVHHLRPDELATDDKEENEKANGYYSIEAIGANNTFRFEVNFDNLSSEELGLLIYSIELEKGLGHKIGKAKPQGMGSVEMTVENIVCRNYQNKGAMEDKTEDKSSFRNSAFSWLENTFDHSKKWYEISHVKDLLNVLMIPPADKQYRVAYPALDEQNEISDKSLPKGYTYKKLKGILSGTASSNQRRLDHFTIPWHPWHPLTLEETDANARGETGHSEPPPGGIVQKKPLHQQDKDHIPPSEVLRVARFDKNIEEQDLRDVFGKVGTVKDVDIRPAWENKCFAWVTMATIEEAADAIKIIDGTKIKNQEVTVKFKENVSSKRK